MSYDPFGDDEDIFIDDDKTEEILESGQDPDLDSGNNHKHTIDGSECPTCGVIHSNPFGSLDENAQNAMLSFMDSLPNTLVQELLGNTDTKRPQAEMLTAFLSYTERMDNTNTIGPPLRAVIEHLDEETNGRITAKWRIYDAERRLVLTHRILKSINTALDDSSSNEAPAGQISLLELLLDYSRERISMLVETYQKACDAINYEPIQSVIEYGQYPDNDDDPNSYDFFEKILYTELSAH